MQCPAYLARPLIAARTRSTSARPRRTSAELPAIYNRLAAPIICTSTKVRSGATYFASLAANAT